MTQQQFIVSVIGTKHINFWKKLEGKDMKYNIEKFDTRWQLTWSFDTDAPAQDIWECLTETSKIRDWFPELSFDGEHMKFQLEDNETYELQVYDFQPHQRLEMDWFDCKLRYEIDDLGQARRVGFKEMIPEGFPHPDRDMAGWIMNGYSIESLMDKETMPMLDEMMPNIISQVQAIMIKKEQEY